MHYILIGFILHYNTSASVRAEFNSKVACISAEAAFERKFDVNFQQANAICVRKGK